ncbi:hypothetical protein AM500_04215 [Bacillus sp. FJAT-18017]|nr:hypothetical protein AM500_04215 [Bacillus sp. FJAT-18017]
MISAFTTLLLAYIYYIPLLICTDKMKSLNETTEKKAIAICLCFIVWAFLIYKFHKLGGFPEIFPYIGFTIAGILVLSAIWLVIIKKISQNAYQKSVKRIEKYLINHL